MLIVHPVILSVPVFLAFLYIVVQQQKLGIIGECCICRREITRNEDTIICPDCHTIYHSKHLSLWLKIRKKCPICKNIIKNHYPPFYVDTKDIYLSINRNTSYFSVNSHQNRRRINIREFPIKEDSFILECPHCTNILDSHTYGVSSQCQTCGSRISWKYFLESRIKSLDNLPTFKKKKIRINKRVFSRIKGQNVRKINHRNIKRQKEVNREDFRKRLEEQTQLELQDLMLSFNKDFPKRQRQIPNHDQYIPLRMIEFRNKAENPRKINFLELEKGIALIIVIVIFFLVTILI